MVMAWLMPSAKTRSRQKFVLFPTKEYVRFGGRAIGLPVGPRSFCRSVLSIVNSSSALHPYLVLLSELLLASFSGSHRNRHKLIDAWFCQDKNSFITLLLKNTRRMQNIRSTQSVLLGMITLIYPFFPWPLQYPRK